jgi:multiple sugar transport system permease protein
MSCPFSTGSRRTGMKEKKRIHPIAQRKWVENLAGFAFISPWLIGFLAFTALPMLFSFYYSFTEYDILSSPVFNGLRNFRRMLGDDLFWKSLEVTFYYAFVSVPLRLIFAFFIALLFKTSDKWVYYES